jgi:hypothetical protein
VAVKVGMVAQKAVYAVIVDGNTQKVKDKNRKQVIFGVPH